MANVSGSVTSNPTMLGTPTHGNRTAQATNLWSILPYERPYLTTNHNEYGLAINPVNNNVLLLTRGMPTNMMVILDPLTGAQKHYIDWSDLLPLPGNSGYNKVDISDDGIIYLCNLTYNTTNTPFRIDALSDDGTANAGKPAFAGRSLYIGDPGNGKTQSNVVWGIAMAVRGSRPNVEILLGSGSYDQSSKTFAILREQGDGSFLSTAITVTNAPDKFARLGIDFGPEPNTIWGKTVGNLVLVQYDLATETGWVKKTYPTTGTRSVAYSVTGIRYDKNYNLLAGIQNGAPPSPVSVPIYNVANLEAGPLWVDQELYTTYNNEVNFQGNVDFANGYLVAMGGNNGLKGFQINPGFVPLPIILTHPVGGTWFENASSPTIQVVADATASISYQWYKETEPLVGRTQSSLTLTNIQLTDAGDYWVRVSTAGGSVDSDAATMEVLPYNNTAQMTTLWTALPLTQTYLNTKYYEYGMSFNPVNSNLLVASFIPLADNPTNPTPAIIGVLDGLTGTHKRVLNTTSITNGGNRWVNKIGVANDGVVYVGNRTTTPGSVNFVLYRYANDEAETVAGIAYKGDPFATMYNGTSKNVGFTMDVRGAGVNTEVLLSTGGTNLLSILSTTDGTNFTAKEYHVPGAARNFARLGVCFGPGNTIWTKAWGGDGGIMHLVGYNPSAGTASVLQTYTEMPYEMTTLAYNDSLKLLGAISRDSHKNLQLYSVVDQEVGPMLVDQEVFPTYNASIEANGALDFGGNTYLFGLNENNGIMAMLINPTYAPPTVVSATVDNGVVTLSWPAVNGGSYQVQYKSALDGTWQNLGSAISATSTTATFSENVAVGPRFYRVESLNP